MHTLRCDCRQGHGAYPSKRTRRRAAPKQKVKGGVLKPAKGAAGAGAAAGPPKLSKKAKEMRQRAADAAERRAAGAYDTPSLSKLFWRGRAYVWLCPNNACYLPYPKEAPPIISEGQAQMQVDESASPGCICVLSHHQTSYSNGSTSLDRGVIGQGRHQARFNTWKRPPSLIPQTMQHQGKKSHDPKWQPPHLAIAGNVNVRASYISQQTCFLIHAAQLAARYRRQACCRSR